MKKAKTKVRGFRLHADLLSTLTKLAIVEKRSLNNYVSYVLNEHIEKLYARSASYR